MVRRIKIRKTPIFLMLLFTLVLSFSQVYFFSVTAFAPSVSDIPDSAAPSLSDAVLNPPLLLEFLIPHTVIKSPSNTGDVNSYQDPAVNEYIAIRMDTSHISQGSLLLINHDNYFEIPDLNGFIVIDDKKTRSYRVSDENALLSEAVIAPLNDMMDAFYAETGQQSVTITSAFRNYDRQQKIHDEYVALMGQKEAIRWASLPGYSEHHAGLAVDLGIYSGGAERIFNGTGVYEWFSQHSYKYGFVLRFPSDKADITKIAYEPWHYRYVGEPHSYVMYENNLCFEEYIEMLTRHTFEEPYKISYDKKEYVVYFSRDMSIPIPFDCEFDISGNNIDGFIITAKFSG